MLPTSPDIVLFAIRSALKLSQQMRQAYLDNLKQRELVLPLPNFPSRADWISALNYFEDAGSEYVAEFPRIRELLSKAQNRTLTVEEKAEFELCHQEMRAASAARKGEFTAQGVSAEAMLDLFRVRQWRKGTAPNPTALKRVAGTLIEIGVDYFANTPGALNSKSAHARAIKGFFAAIDEVSFVDTPVEKIAEGLFVAAIETINATPELLSGDQKVQQLVQAVVKGLVTDAKARMANNANDLAAQERIQGWTELVFRSVLSNAGKIVLTNPADFLGVQKGAESALVSSVGNAILDTILENESLSLDALFSREALDKLAKTALGTVVEHPELLRLKNDGVKLILAAVVKQLAQTTAVLGPDLLPEVMRLILEKTAINLELVWPGDFSDPKKHLLIAAAKETLTILAREPAANDTWKPRFSKSQIMSLLELILREVSKNPDWLLVETEQKNPILREALEGALAALRQAPSGRLSADTGIAILRAAVKAVANRREFIEKIGPKNQRLVTIAIQAVFEAVLSEQVASEIRWVLAHADSLEAIVAHFLQKLSASSVSLEKIEKLKTILIKETAKLSQGGVFILEILLTELDSAQI